MANKNQKITASDSCKKGLGVLHEIFNLLKGNFVAFLSKPNTTEQKPKNQEKKYIWELVEWNKNYAKSEFHYQKYGKDELASILNFFAKNKEIYKNVEFLTDEEEIDFQKHISGEKILPQEKFEKMLKKKSAVYLLNQSTYSPLSEEETKILETLSQRQNLSVQEKNKLSELNMKVYLLEAKNFIQQNQVNNNYLAEVYSVAEEYEIIKVLNFLDNLFNNNPYFDSKNIPFVYGKIIGLNFAMYDNENQLIILFRKTIVKALKGEIASPMKSIFHEYDHHLQRKSYVENKIQNINNGEGITFDYYNKNTKSYDFHSIINFLYNNLNLIDSKNLKSEFLNDLKFAKRKAYSEYELKPILNIIESTILNGVYFNLAHEIDARAGGKILATKFFESLIDDIDDKKLKHYLRRQKNSLNSTNEEDINQLYIKYYKDFVEVIKSSYTKLVSSCKNTAEKENFMIFYNDLLTKDELENLIKNYETSETINPYLFNINLKSDKFFRVAKSLSTKAFVNILRNSLVAMKFYKKFNQENYEFMENELEKFLVFYNNVILNENNIFNQKKFNELNAELFSDRDKNKDVIDYLYQNDKDMLDEKPTNSAPPSSFE